MDIGYFLKLMTEKNASDMFLTTGAPVHIKVEGKLYPLGNSGLPAGMVKKIAYSLMDEGQVPQFERDLECEVPLRTHLRRRIREIGWPAIAGPVLVLTALLLAVTAVALMSYGLGAGATLLLIALFALPASEAAMGLYNTLVSVFVKPTRLIGYEFKDGIPAHARTLVVAPVLIGSRDDIDEAVDRLRQAGGRAVQGPDEIPGDCFALVAEDDRGARFGLVGPRTG